ncbi:MAG: tRNA (cytidine/uridine-2'-O-)-methyltransferase TrmJ [Chroococcopsis gigantea SAG 12.99]|jgi:tRNA/rRNA methyltransferase|nr:tRNA (cytidine/uridine-2'-O-)-methyltransferase TrmJ [Chroococcopsis gigantea SAG 12.99]
MLENIRIILVEPAGALNVGSVARVMKNMGLKRLLLVDPQCDHLGEEATRMAVHGVEILKNCEVVPDLPSALIGCHRAAATTDRVRNQNTPLETPKEVIPWLLNRTLESALIFGPEYRGLSNGELHHAQRWLGIPANPEYTSLNLAQAVAICTYELYQSHWQENHTSHPVLKSSPPASLDALEGYYSHLERVLLQIQYLYPHTATAKMEKFRHLHYRAVPTVEELALLRGILGHIERNWATFQEPDKSQEQ